MRKQVAIQLAGVTLTLALSVCLYQLFSFGGKLICFKTFCWMYKGFHFIDWKTIGTFIILFGIMVDFYDF